MQNLNRNVQLGIEKRNECRKYVVVNMVCGSNKAERCRKQRFRMAKIRIYDSLHWRSDAKIFLLL